MSYFDIPANDATSGKVTRFCITDANTRPFTEIWNGNNREALASLALYSDLDSKLDASKIELSNITSMYFYREAGTNDVNIVWKNYSVQYRLKVSSSGLAFYQFDGSNWTYIWGK